MMSDLMVVEFVCCDGVSGELEAANRDNHVRIQLEIRRREKKLARFLAQTKKKQSIETGATRCITKVTHSC